MKKINKVTEQEIDVVGSSKHTVNIKAIISFVMMVTVFIIGFNFRINKANYLEPEVEEVVSVTTTENMSTTMGTTTSIVTTTSTSCVTTTPCTTVATTEEVTTTTEEECIITMPVNIQVVIDEPVQEDPSPEPIIETEPVVVEVVEESSTEESIDPPIVEEEPVAVEETEPVSMTYLGNLYITGYVATGNPTASGPYPYVGGVAMSRSYGLEWGTTIYIDGLGYYTLFDTGCSYGVVDVFCNTIPECYDLTSYRDVYVVN